MVRGPGDCGVGVDVGSDDDGGDDGKDDGGHLDVTGGAPPRSNPAIAWQEPGEAGVQVAHRGRPSEDNSRQDQCDSSVMVEGGFMEQDEFFGT